MTEETFNADASLPTALRGYDREAVDNLLEEIEKNYRALIAERDELRSSLADANERLSEVTAELENHVAGTEAAAKALGEAQGLQESIRALSAERDELRGALTSATERLSQLEAELEHHVGRERAVVDALIETERLKSGAESEVQALKEEAEREIAELRGRAEQETQELRTAAERAADEIRARAEAEADELLGEARARADRLVEAVQQNLEERQHQAEDLLDDARAKLSSLVRDLFDRIDEGSREQQDVSVGTEQSGS